MGIKKRHGSWLSHPGKPSMEKEKPLLSGILPELAPKERGCLKSFARAGMNLNRKA